MYRFGLLLTNGFHSLVDSLDDCLPAVPNGWVLLHFLLSRERRQRNHLKRTHQLSVAFQPVGQLEKLCLIVADRFLLATESGSRLGLLDEGAVLAAFKFLLQGLNVLRGLFQARNHCQRRASDFLNGVAPVERPMRQAERVHHLRTFDFEELVLFCGGRGGNRIEQPFHGMSPLPLPVLYPLVEAAGHGPRCCGPANPSA